MQNTVLMSNLQVVLATKNPMKTWASQRLVRRQFGQNSEEINQQRKIKRAILYLYIYAIGIAISSAIFICEFFN